MGTGRPSKNSDRALRAGRVRKKKPADLAKEDITLRANDDTSRTGCRHKKEISKHGKKLRTYDVTRGRAAPVRNDRRRGLRYEDRKTKSRTSSSLGIAEQTDREGKTRAARHRENTQAILTATPGRNGEPTSSEEFDRTQWQKKGLSKRTAREGVGSSLRNCHYC